MAPSRGCRRAVGASVFSFLMREVLSRYRLPGARFRCYPPQAIRYFRNTPASLECWRTVPPGPEGGGTMSTISCPHDVSHALAANSQHSQGKKSAIRARARKIRFARPGQETRSPLLFHGLLCVSSSRGGRANLHCIIPILRMVPEGNLGLSQP